MTRGPLWSVMIPTYESGDYLGATLESVLRQDQGEDAMEIVVVDDHSVDDVEAIVARIGQGRVQFIRQPQNLGHARNFNDCLRRAHGEIVHLLHGDDVVFDHFYEVMQRPLLEHPAVGAAICRYQAIDATGRPSGPPGELLRETPGIIPDWLRTIASGQAVQPPALVVRRSVYRELGGFVEDIQGYAEDWELLVRIAAHCPVWFQSDVLAGYRVRPGSLSDVDRLRSNMQDMRLVFALNHTTVAAALSEAEAQQITTAAQHALGEALLRRARRRVFQGDLRFPGLSISESLRFDRRPATVVRIVRLLVGWVQRLLRSKVVDFVSDARRRG